MRRHNQEKQSTATRLASRVTVRRRNPAPACMRRTQPSIVSSAAQEPAAGAASRPSLGSRQPPSLSARRWPQPCSKRRYPPWLPMPRLALQRLSLRCRCRCRSRRRTGALGRCSVRRRGSRRTRGWIHAGRACNGCAGSGGHARAPVGIAEKLLGGNGGRDGAPVDECFAGSGLARRNLRFVRDVDLGLLVRRRVAHRGVDAALISALTADRIDERLPCESSTATYP